MPTQDDEEHLDANEVPLLLDSRGVARRTITGISSCVSSRGAHTPATLEPLFNVTAVNYTNQVIIFNNPTQIISGSSCGGFGVSPDLNMRKSFLSRSILLWKRILRNDCKCMPFPTQGPRGRRLLLRSSANQPCLSDECWRTERPEVDPKRHQRFRSTFSQGRTHHVALTELEQRASKQSAAT